MQVDTVLEKELRDLYLYLQAAGRERHWAKPFETSKPSPSDTLPPTSATP